MGCLEDALTPDALLHGYRHSVAGAVGFTPHRELALTLTDQPPAFYSSTSLSYWRKSLRQQLQGPARQLAAKRKAHILYDQPIVATGRDAGSSAVPSGRSAGGTALPAGGLASLPPPRFPLQPSRSQGGKEGVETGVGEQLAAAGAPPLRTLGWGDGGQQLPLSLPFARQLEVLADAAVPLPRALWLLRVTALNRARPAGWCGAADVQQRSRQLTEELLAFLEAAAAAQTAGVVAGRPPRPAAAAGVQPEEPSMGTASKGGTSGTQDGTLTHWQYGLRLAGHCCSAGLLDGAKVAEWAASVRVLLPLSSARRREVLALLQQCLRATPLAQQQVLALAELCLRSAEAAATATVASTVSAAVASTSEQRQRHQQPQQMQQAGWQQEAQELRALLLQAAEQLLVLHPAAFVAADDALLLPLEASRGETCSAAVVGGEVKAARQRLSRSLHARVLHWTDDKAMQLLDAQLQAGASMAQATSALHRLVSTQPGAEAGEGPPDGSIMEATRLICEWAVAAPSADFGAALVRAAAVPEPQGQEQLQQWQAGEQLDGAAALAPERVLYALSLLQAVQADLQAPPPPQPKDCDRASTTAAPLQSAIQCWLSRCGGQPHQQPWQRQRVLHLALLLAEAGLLCPAALLQSLLASGVLRTAAAPVASSGDGTAANGSFQLELLRQLHPLLEYPTLASTTASSGGKAWPLARLRYAAARNAVLLQSTPAAGRGSFVGAHARLATGTASGEERGWHKMVQAASGDSDTQSSDSSAGGTPGAGGPVQPQAVWQDPALRDLQDQLLALLGLPHSRPAAGAAARATASPASPASAPALEQLLQQVRRLEPWQQRHTAAALLAAAKAFLASTDSGGRAAGGRASTPISGSPPPLSPGSPPAAGWVLQLLAVLQACCGRREVLSLLATCLNLLQRAVAAAVRAAAATGSSGQQREQALADCMEAAQRGWQQRSGVQPALLFSLLSAQGDSLAAADISVKLLPMLAGGVWRLQQPWQQQAARSTLAGQLHLAAELLALPGANPQQWLANMSEQHGASHWVVTMLQQQAAVLAARAGSAAAASSASSQQAAAQQLQAAGELLESFGQRAAQVQAGSRAGAEAGIAGGTAARRQHGMPAAAASSAVGLLLAPVPQPGSELAPWEAASLAAVQHSLSPAALPAVLKQLASCSSSAPGSPDLQHQLAALAPAASRALLSDPQQAYASLQQLQQHLPAAGSSSPAAAPWQLALALFASSSGLGAHAGGLALLKLSSAGAMAAAVAATTPTTARCAWLLLRLLLDEQQWQGGHRLAEAEKALAQRAARQAILRPASAAALAATLCSLSPSAAAGQQLLHEIEGLLRLPVVELARQAAAPGSSWHRLHPATTPALAPAASADVPVAAPPFDAEQGVADAALVCLSSGSSGERQHAFAQQLIRQLAALADLLHQQQHQSTQEQPQPQAVPAPPLDGSPASPAAAQVSVWMRLSLLLPLLPLIYKHRAADSGGGLRGQLLLALLRLLAAPAINADASLAVADAPANQPAAAVAAAAAAAAAAGEPLSQRLLHLLRALLVGGWASWMRLQGGKLRDVPPYEHSRQLAAEAAALPLSPSVHAAVVGALPLALQQGLMTVPSCLAVSVAAPARGRERQRAAPGKRGSASSSSKCSTLVLDPWLLLEGGSAVASSADGTTATGPPAAELQAAVPPWLEGAVKRRRRDLCYMPGGPVEAEVPPRSLEDQLGL
ncbi:hypothetical protein ACK3TF_004402 [Chlorella vulgaris]